MHSHNPQDYMTHGQADACNQPNTQCTHKHNNSNTLKQTLKAEKEQKKNENENEINKTQERTQKERIEKNRIFIRNATA